MSLAPRSTICLHLPSVVSFAAHSVIRADTGYLNPLNLSDFNNSTPLLPMYNTFIILFIYLYVPYTY